MTFVLTVFVVLSLFPILSAIQCYNGAQGVYVNNPKTLPTVDCGGGVSTCSKTVDLVGQIATRSCGPGTTCTYAGAQSNKGYCYNVSTSQTQCCCYGNLCNDSVRVGVNIGYLIIPLLILFGFQSRHTNVMSLLPLFAAALLVPILSAVRCYNGAQGVYINNPKSLATIDCGNAINTCSKTVDLSAQIANRACGPAYTCLYQNGTSSPRGFCFNISTAQTSCCCYGSLCNDTARSSINTVFVMVPLLVLFFCQSRRLIM